MGIRERLRKLEEAAKGEVLVIPQRDGTVARFPPGADAEAFLNLIERMGAGKDAPPEHPLIAAARNSSDPKWSGSFFAINDTEEWTGPIPDLSE